MNFGDTYKRSPRSRSQNSGFKYDGMTMAQPILIGDIPVSGKGVGKVMDWLKTFEESEDSKEKPEEFKPNLSTSDKLLPLINRLRRIGIHNEEIISRIQRGSELPTRPESTVRDRAQQMRRTFAKELVTETRNEVPQPRLTRNEAPQPRLTRIDELARPKKQHHYHLPIPKSPMWKVTRSALSVEPSRRIKELAEPKIRRSDHTSFNTLREVPSPNYQCSSRIAALAQPKYFPAQNLQVPLPIPVKQTALRTVDSDHVQRLSKPKVYISQQVNVSTQEDKKKKKPVGRKVKQDKY